MSHRSYEELASELDWAAEQYPLGTDYVMNGAQLWRQILYYAIEEASDLPGVVYEASDWEHHLLFSPTHRFEEFSSRATKVKVNENGVALHESLMDTHWRHVKTGNDYRVTAIARHAISGEDGLVYYPEATPTVFFFRPYQEFIENVEVEGKQTPRFILMNRAHTE